MGRLGHHSCRRAWPAGHEAAQGEAQRHGGAHEQGRLPAREHLDRAQEAGYVVAADLLRNPGQLIRAAPEQVAEPCLLVAQIACRRVGALGHRVQAVGDPVLLPLDLVAETLLDGAAEAGNFLAHRFAGGTSFPGDIIGGTLDLFSHASCLVGDLPLGHGRAAPLRSIVGHRSALNSMAINEPLFLLECSCINRISASMISVTAPVINPTAGVPDTVTKLELSCSCQLTFGVYQSLPFNRAVAP